MSRNGVEPGRPPLRVRLADGACPYCPAADVRLDAADLAGLADHVRLIRAERPDLVVECGPADVFALGPLKAVGVAEVGIHVGSLDETVRARCGDGAVLPLAGYERAWDEAVRVFGRFRVSTCLVVGAGENPGELVTGAARLIARGVQPVVVPYRPGPDALVRWIGHAVTDMLRTVGASVTPPQPIGPTTGWGMR